MGKSEQNINPIQEAMKLAQTPAGQQLIALLQATGGQELRNALEQAAVGDYEKAQQAISSLMRNPQAKKLFEQMGGKP